LLGGVHGDGVVDNGLPGSLPLMVPGWLEIRPRAGDGAVQVAGLRCTRPRDFGHAYPQIGTGPGVSARQTCIDYDRTTTNVSDGSINRYYDPTTGQFLSVDPAVGLTQAPYSYTNDDPVNETDPLGLWGWNPVSDVTQAAKDTGHFVAQHKKGIEIGAGIALGVAAAATGVGAVIEAAGGSFSCSGRCGCCRSLDGRDRGRSGRDRGRVCRDLSRTT
jgi:RHS repeat-associated protein